MGQFIHASSIHVENTQSFVERGNDTLIAKPREFVTNVTSGYGRRKRAEEVAVERLAPMFKNGAVSLRLGGVTPSNVPLREHKRPGLAEHEQKVWLEKDDMAQLVNLVTEHPLPELYEVVYAVSANDGRFHDTSNTFGWQPEANSKDYL